jgi:hypothetical protein
MEDGVRSGRIQHLVNAGPIQPLGMSFGFWPDVDTLARLVDPEKGLAIGTFSVNRDSVGDRPR